MQSHSFRRATWHESTTANIGKIGGGSGTNIVSESCRVEGEIRSLNHETAMELLETYHRTFQQEADEDRCEAGLGRKAEYPCV